MQDDVLGVENAPRRQIDVLYDNVTLSVALEMVRDERHRQIARWGEQNHAIDRWVMILGEEFGGLCEAACETIFDNGPEKRARGGYDNLLTEACQCAAVATQIIEYLMRNRALYHKGE